MTNLNKTITIDPQFTADQWHLYDIEGRNAVAQLLNARLKDTVNRCKTDLEKIRSMMETVMTAHSRYGSMDSEPHWFLERVLRQIFGEEEFWTDS